MGPPQQQEGQTAEPGEEVGRRSRSARAHSSDPTARARAHGSDPAATRWPAARTHTASRPPHAGPERTRAAASSLAQPRPGAHTRAALSVGAFRNPGSPSVPSPSPAPPSHVVSLPQRNRRSGYTPTGGRRGSAERLPHAWPDQEHTGMPTPTRARTTATTRRLTPAYGTHTPCCCRRLPEHRGLFPSEHLCPREPCTLRPHAPSLSGPPQESNKHSEPRWQSRERTVLPTQARYYTEDPRNAAIRVTSGHSGVPVTPPRPPQNTLCGPRPLRTCSLEPFPSVCPGQTPRKVSTLSKWCDPLSVPQGNVPWDTPKPGQLSAPREQTSADLPANQSIRLKRTCLC